VQRSKVVSNRVVDLGLQHVQPDQFDLVERPAHNQLGARTAQTTCSVCQQLRHGLAGFHVLLLLHKQDLHAPRQRAPVGANRRARCDGAQW
jgi:hypothetical protein